MSTDPTANPNPDEGASSRPSDWTSPPGFGSSSQPSVPPPPPPPPPAPDQGQGQPYYAPAPPPAPGYGSGGMYAGGQEHPKGTMVLILGIVSLVFCQILGPVAWVMGRRVLTEIDASGRTATNRSMVQAGMICGIIATVFLVIGLLWLLLVVVIGIGAASTGGVR